MSKYKLTLGHLGLGTGIFEPFDQLFNKSFLIKDVKDINKDKVDALVIWGGQDISPTLYGELPHKYTGADNGLSTRDKIESEACLEAKKNNIPIIGVCRGAQLLCALAGGKLIQHVDNHGGTHSIKDIDGKELKTSSVHHQMMFPFDIDHEMIAWSKQKLSPVYLGTSEYVSRMVEEDLVEPEVVYFPEFKGLGIQGHPEFMSPSSEFVQYSLEKVERYLLK